MDILLICSGNQCRSPLAAAMLGQRLGKEGVEARVRSAGLLGEGQPVPPEVVKIGRRAGLDLTGHRSSRLSVEELTAADLTLGMAREHVREAVLAAPVIWPRCFTLKEIVRRGRALGPRRRDEETAGWLAEVHEGRQRVELLGSSRDDDVEDPMGGSERMYEATAQELSLLVDRLLALLWPAGGASRGDAGPR